MEPPMLSMQKQIVYYPMYQMIEKYACSQLIINLNDNIWYLCEGTVKNHNISDGNILAYGFMRFLGSIWHMEPFECGFCQVLHIKNQKNHQNHHGNTGFIG